MPLRSKFVKAQSINLTAGAMNLAINYLSDAVFLLYLWREQQGTGDAVRFARDNSDASVGPPWFAKGEFIKAVTYVNFSIWDFPTSSPPIRHLDFIHKRSVNLEIPCPSSGQVMYGLSRWPVSMDYPS